MDDRWLSVDEIAAYLGIKKATIYKWLSRQDMPAHKVGRLWKFRKDEVDDWVRSGSSRPALGAEAPAGSRDGEEHQHD
jgi:excisionase family DNA binding protein